MSTENPAPQNDPKSVNDRAKKPVLGFGQRTRAYFFAGILVTFLLSSAVWVPVFSMKSQTKQLVVSAACEPFGFTYDTLHHDMKSVSDLRSLGTWIKANSGNLTATSVPPTPAFDRLKDAGLMPSYDSRKFEDLITGQVVNWSHSDDFVRLDIYFGTAYNDDPHIVRKLAIDAAKAKLADAGEGTSDIVELAKPESVEAAVGQALGRVSA